MAQVAARSFFHAGQGSNLTGRCADALRGARQNDALPGSQSGACMLGAGCLLSAVPCFASELEREVAELEEEASRGEFWYCEDYGLCKKHAAIAAVDDTAASDQHESKDESHVDSLHTSFKLAGQAADERATTSSKHATPTWCEAGGIRSHRSSLTGTATQGSASAMEDDDRASGHNGSACSGGHSHTHKPDAGEEEVVSVPSAGAPLRTASCSDDLIAAADQQLKQCGQRQAPSAAQWMGGSLQDTHSIDATGRASLPALPMLGLTEPGVDAFVTGMGLYPLQLQAVSKHPLEADMEEDELGSGGVGDAFAAAVAAGSEAAGSDASTGTPTAQRLAALAAGRAPVAAATLLPGVRTLVTAGSSTVDSAPASADAAHAACSAPKQPQESKRPHAEAAAPPPPLPPRQARTTKNSKQALKSAAELAAASATSPRGKKRTAGRIAANPTGHSCTQCGTQSTPVWRAGPHGPKTLCNACGVRYMKVAKRK